MQDQSSAGNGNFFPWCATALAALCVLVSLWAAGAAQPLLAAGEKDLAAAEEEWLRHPYLETGPLLEARLGADRIQHERGTYESERVGRGAPPMPPGVVRREQTALDEKLEAVATARGSLPARRFGIDPLELRWTSLLTHVPIHSSIAHLFGNVVLLVYLGLYLESHWGRARFLAICAVAAAGTGLGYTVTSPDSLRPFVGASGMLAGLLPLFALYYLKERSDGFYWVGLVLGTVWLVLPPLAGFQWSIDAPGASLLASRVPQHASLGAYAGAVLCAFAAFQLLRLTGLEAFALQADAPTPSAPDVGRIARLRARGKLDDALVQATTWTRREPESLDAVLTLHEVAKALGRAPAARTALLRAVRLELQGGLLAAAVDHWHELADGGEVPREAEPAVLIRLASLLDETGDRRLATRTLRAALGNAGDAARAVVAGRVARAARDMDPKLAHDAAWRALQSTEIELEERHALEELLAGVIPRLPDREIDVPSAPAAAHAERPEPIEIETAVRVLDVIDAVPVELDDEGIHVQTPNGNKKRVRYDRIEAVSVVAVQGLAEKPVLLVDLVLDWKAPAGNRLRVIRLRADRFDPRRVIPNVSSPVDAMRQMVSVILSRSQGVPLPDADAARGMPFASFEELALYQRLVLLADGPPSPPPAPAAAAAPADEAAPEQTRYWELTQK